MKETVDLIVARFLEIMPESGYTELELEFAIESAVYYVLDFCHLDILPPELHSLIIQMVVDLFKEETIFDSDQEADMKSIKEGDFLMSFTTRLDKMKYIASSKNFLRKYKVRLYRYRRLAK